MSSLEDRMSYKEMYLMYKNQCEEQKDYILKLEKENQELIVNKNVAQAVAFDQKREIAELKDQISYLKEDGEEWQSAYEWSQAQNAILKLENEELREKLQETVINTMNLVSQENEKLKKAIEILKDKMRITVNIPYVWFEDKDNCLYFKVNQQEYELLKEVLGNE